MKFGVSASGIDPRRIAEFAVRAEQLGYESVWMPEHIIMPTVIKSAPPHAGRRPGTSIDMSGAGFLPMLDPFMTLCSLASVTTRVRLGTSVALIALRDPFLAARCITTLDLLSAGRATVGVGAGWCDEEYQLMGVDFAGRGRRLEEMLEIFTELFTAPLPEFHGEVFDFPPVAFEPKPIQLPRPPILMGGNSRSALRRAARFADGWIGVSLSPEQTAEHIGVLAQLRQELKREGPFEIDMRVEGELTPEFVSEFENVGVQRLIFRGLRMELRAGTEEAFDHIEQVASQVDLASGTSSTGK